MPKDLPDLKPGDALSADWLNTLRAWLRRAGIRVDAGSGLRGNVGPQGTALSISEPEAMWIKLTGHTGVAYSWTEQVPDTAGTWQDGIRTGTTTVDPAYEANGVTTVTTGRIVWGTRDRSVGEMRFTFGAC